MYTEMRLLGIHIATDIRKRIVLLIPEEKSAFSSAVHCSCFLMFVFSEWATDNVMLYYLLSDTSIVAGIGLLLRSKISDLDWSSTASRTPMYRLWVSVTLAAAAFEG